MKPDALTDAKWQSVERCPACGAYEVTERAPLPGSAYTHADEKIDYPAAGIPLVTCAKCSLTYKGIVPQPGFLAQVFSRQAGKIWMDDYAFESEIRLLKKMIGSDCFDVLDVGASNGALLKACSRANVTGRRSALDLIAHPGLEAQLSGELIDGFLDSALLSWSGVPYQVVTLFDLLEHLYEPEIAFENLHMLLDKDGVVLLETGNIESYWPRKFGRANWWYVNLFPHHIFWSRSTLTKFAERHEFGVVLWEDKRHKDRGFPLLHEASNLAKVGAYRLLPRYYSSLVARFGKRGGQPGSPFTRDHFRVCLRRI
jgi:hypothetical protein